VAKMLRKAQKPARTTGRVLRGVATTAVVITLFCTLACSVLQLNGALLPRRSHGEKQKACVKSLTNGISRGTMGSALKKEVVQSNGI
jgi:hypothetical protein